MDNEENNTESDRIFTKPPIIRFSHIQQNIQEETDETEIIQPISKSSLEIVATAHISDKSVESVRKTIYEKKPEIVAIELDLGRYQGLVDESRGIKREEKFDLKSLLKSSNLTVTIVSAFLSHMQKKMGEEVGVKPGSEMLEASKIAREVNADIALIDRNIQTTLKRTISGMSLKEKLSFVWDLIKSFIFSDDEDESFKEEVEQLKQEDTIKEVMDFFKEASPGGYNALVHERDAYMALFIVVFVGAYIQGLNIGEGIITYLIFAGGGALIGSLLSGSKIQSALVGMVVAPVTVIHPLLAAGWFSGLVEGKLRKVGFDDLAELADFESFKDLWHNKLFRVILVVLGTNIGCTIGFLITLNNVFVPYIHVIFGI